MLAEVVQQPLFFLLSSAWGIRVQLQTPRDNFRQASSRAIVNRAPRPLDGRKGNAQSVAEFFVRTSAERQQQQPLFAPAESKLRRMVVKKDAEP